jgi:hypothetical protein
VVHRGVLRLTQLEFGFITITTAQRKAQKLL